MQDQEVDNLRRSWPDRKRRFVLYGGALPIAAVLCLLPMVFQGEPDIGTLLSGAQLLTNLGAHDKAIVDCSKVLERDPGNVQAHLLLALAYDRQGERMKAVEVYEDVLHRDLNDEEEMSVRLAIAEVYARDEQFDVAIAKSEEILRFDTANAQAYWLRGLSEYRLGFSDQAYQTLSEASRLAPDDEGIEALFRIVRDEREGEASP